MHVFLLSVPSSAVSPFLPSLAFLCIACDFSSPLGVRPMPSYWSDRSDCAKNICDLFASCVYFLRMELSIQIFLFCNCDLSIQFALHVVVSWARRCQIDLFSGLSVGGRSSVALSGSGAAPLLHDLHSSLVPLMRGRGPPSPSFIV